ncbi:type IV pilus modification protein PilV [Halomonas borealis]|uniref:type IV pilus modification protein PilV n=1 Tax=Halomonas borealis TaxID=2508710 RepID=UPI001F0D0D00|nr:type IV pilus modification protein PilV [Halomonas borealis]
MSSRGFTLIEALVALLVLSIGLLGIAAMQLKSLQGAHAAYQRSIASLAAQDAQERLWAGLAESGSLTCPAEGEVNGPAGTWHAQWETFLPGLDPAPLESSGECEFDLTLTWEDERFAGEAAPALTYTIRLPEGAGGAEE